MKKPLKLGFIGGGINSAVGRAHYAACRMDGLFEVTAGCFSRQAEINEQTAERYNAIPYTSVGALLTCADIDAVVILTPTPYHYDSINLALEANVPIICEKAAVATVQQMEQLATNHADKGFAAVTFNYTGYPMVRELRDMIADGELGTIISIQAEMPQEGYLRTDASPQLWRMQDGEIPSVHLDLGTHLHHLIYFLTGAHVPLRVVSSSSKHSSFVVVDDVRCIAEYGPFTAGLWFGKTALGSRNGLHIRVCGTEASAEWHQMNPEELSISYCDGRREIVDRAAPRSLIASEAQYTRFKAGHPQGFLEAYANVYATIYAGLQAYLNGTPEPCSELLTTYSTRAAYAGLVMMQAVARSEREGTWITL